MVLDLPKELTIARAVELKAALLEALEREARLELNTRGVEEVDAAGLQILCAAHRTASARGREMVVAGGERGPALSAACANAGLIHRHGCRETCLFQEDPHG